MAFDIGSIISSGVTTAISNLSDTVHTWVTTKKDKVIEAQDEEQLQAQIKEVMQQHEDSMNAAMNQVDLVEAGSTNWFVAGWRPAVGWVCVLGLFIHFIVSPLSTWICGLCHSPVIFPPLDITTMLELLGGILGLGTLRTVEKVNGSASNH